ncbi:unnamed protein product, partial [marine sediment metagenome]
RESSSNWPKNDLFGRRGNESQPGYSSCLRVLKGGKSDKPWKLEKDYIEVSLIRKNGDCEEGQLCVNEVVRLF